MSGAIGGGSMLFGDDPVPDPWHQFDNSADWLKRSSHPRAVALRELYEGYYAHYPDANKPDIRARLRSPKGHGGASFELLLHELLRRRFGSVEVARSDSEERQPDFRAGGFDIEALTIERTGENKREDKIIGYVNELVDRTFVRVSARTDHNRLADDDGSLRKRAVQHRFLEWAWEFDGYGRHNRLLLEYRKLWDHIQEKEYPPELWEMIQPNLTIKAPNGWSITFRLEAWLQPGLRDANDLRGLVAGRDRVVVLGPGYSGGTDYSKITRRLVDKASKYRDRALVLAVHLTEGWEAEHHIDIIYGPSGFAVWYDSQSGKPVKSEPTPHSGGFWNRGTDHGAERYSNVKGVWVFEHADVGNPAATARMYPHAADEDFTEQLRFLGYSRLRQRGENRFEVVPSEGETSIREVLRLEDPSRGWTEMEDRTPRPLAGPARLGRLEIATSRPDPPRSQIEGWYDS